MIPRLRLWVIALALASATSPLAQQLPTASPKQLSDAISMQGTQVPNAVNAQPNQHQQNAAPNTSVQHGASQSPDDQTSGRDGSSRSNGKSSGQIDAPKPEEVTAEYTVYLVIATIALVVATMVLAVATVGLYQQTKRLAEQALEASQDTKQSLAFAEKSLAEASDSSKREYRAYVRIIIGEGKLIVGEMPSFSVKLYNYGRTPAVRMRFASSAVIRRNNWCWDDEGPIEDSSLPNLTLHPNDENVVSFISIDAVLPQATLDEILAGRSCLYARGEVFYEDIFGTKRYTKISFMYTADEYNKKLGLRITETGNEAT